MLTLKQKTFAENIHKGIPFSRAYRTAYSSDGMTPKTLWEAGSRLSKNPKVVARLDELKAEKEAEECMLRLSYADLVINELQSMALNSRSEKVRIKALELLGRTVGLFRL